MPFYKALEVLLDPRDCAWNNSGAGVPSRKKAEDGALETIDGDSEQVVVRYEIVAS